MKIDSLPHIEKVTPEEFRNFLLDEIVHSRVIKETLVDSDVISLKIDSHIAKYIKENLRDNKEWCPLINPERE